jgi:DNA-binding NtrC family response regulator
MGPDILVIDDDRDYLDLVQTRLAAAGFPSVELLEDPAAATARLDGGAAVDVALIDLGLGSGEVDGRALLEMIKRRSPATECIMMTAVNDARTAVQCLRQGAYDYLVKPVSEDDLIFSVKRALERKRLVDILHLERSRRPPVFAHPDAFQGIVTRCPALLRVLKEAELHAASDVPILITGESGTGKELLARAVHMASPRRARPFLPVNMAALTGGLFEAEFFGHTRGAFTGADRDRPGHLRHCDGGTLFLDEIGNLPLPMQGKLLRVLQDGEFTPVGSSTPQRADIRFVAATNEDLDQMVTGNRFRRDLYYRIRGSWLHLPALRERPEDIPSLVDHVLKSTPGAEGVRVEDAAMEALIAYEFPGNVRELRSIVLAAVNLCGGRPVSLACLPEPLRRGATRARGAETGDVSGLTLAEVERRHIVEAYRRLACNKVRTARALGVGLNTLRRKLKSYEIK